MRVAIEAALAERSLGTIASLHDVSGGCISNTTRIRSSSGTDLFLKWSDAHPHGLFAEEAFALDAIARSGTVRVPQVVALHDEVSDRVRWLLLEWLEPGAPDRTTWPSLGTSLAALHRVRGEAAGWPRANFIGSLPQSNEAVREWPDFWWTRRLEPQLKLARDRGRMDARDAGRFDALGSSLSETLAAAKADGVSLLHGDLWSGNVHVGRAGTPALLDPSTYYGHREVDLAMSELFGGFEPPFRDAYHEAWPVQPGYDRRRTVYQLYYLLVHVNLFGGSYRAQTMTALRSLGF